MASAVEDVIAALVAAFTAALPGSGVYDEDPLTNETRATYVLVGEDGDPQSDAAVTITQAWTDLACTRRTETGAVPCAVIAQTGDAGNGVYASLRSAAFVVLAGCEAALRTDLSLGVTGLSAQLESGSERLDTNRSGTAVVVPFTVTYTAQV